MQKYAKIVNNITKSVSVGLGNNVDFYLSIGMELMDVEHAYNGQWYLAGYAPTKPAPTTDELSAQLRAERDTRITSCDWIISRHAEQTALGVGTTLTAEDYAAWLAYRQTLRDLPSLDGFPWDGGGDDTPWPTEPVADNAEPAS